MWLQLSNRCQSVPPRYDTINNLSPPRLTPVPMAQGWIETFGVPSCPLELIQIYDANANTYDDHMTRRCYTAHLRSVEIHHKFRPDPTTNILDLCAGTGLVGSALHSKGFRNLYGHDGSLEMTKIAKTKNVYKAVYQELLHADLETSVIPKSYFDVVICCGSIIPGHLSTAHIPLMVSLLKDNGIIVILTRKQFLRECPESTDVEKEFQQHNQAALSPLLLNGLCKLIYEETCVGYSHDCEGTIIVLQK